jgi:zona occludens toxin (predicted ATPase)
MDKGGDLMISLYSGTPGSGKSLHAASIIFWMLKRGRPVVCNFPVNVSKISKKPEKINFFELNNDEMTPEWLITFSKVYFWSVGGPVKEGSITLIIDECQLLFNAREWQKTGRSEWLSFFTQHRKYGYNIILVAQFDRMIDRQIRSLIEYEYVHRKVSNFGVGGFFLNLFAGGKLFVAVKIWYPLNEKIGSEFFRAKKKYYSLYNIFDTFGSDEIKNATAAQSATGSRDPSRSATADAEIEQNQSEELQIANRHDKLPDGEKTA